MFAGKLFTSFINKISYKFFRNRNVAEFALILAFLLAFIAEEFGVAAIIGAYFTGIVFSLTPFASRVEKDISSIAYTVIIANLGKSLELINDAIFTSSVLLVLVSTLITPPLLKKAYGVKKTKNLNVIENK